MAPLLTVMSRRATHAYFDSIVSKEKKKHARRAGSVDEDDDLVRHTRQTLLPAKEIIQSLTSRYFFHRPVYW
jgi:hypothetical protein